MLRHAPFCKNKEVTLRAATMPTPLGPTAEPNAELTPIQQASQSIINGDSNYANGIAATDELNTYLRNNGHPSHQYNALESNYSFWVKYQHSTDPNVVNAWEAYKAWLVVELESPYASQYPWSRIDYGEWWLSTQINGTYNNYKWN